MYDVQESLVIIDNHPSIVASDATINWLLTIDAIHLYSSPYRILVFNYAQYAGDFDCLHTIDADVNDDDDE